MTKATVMRNAWRIAREGQEKFGGKVSEYLSEAMKMAWEQYRLYVEYETQQTEKNDWLSKKSTAEQDKEIMNLLRYFAPLSHDVNFDTESFKAIVIDWSNKKGEVTKQEADKMINELLNFKNNMVA